MPIHKSIMVVFLVIILFKCAYTHNMCNCTVLIFCAAGTFDLSTDKELLKNINQELIGCKGELFERVHSIVSFFSVLKGVHSIVRGSHGYDIKHSTDLHYLWLTVLSIKVNLLIVLIKQLYVII